MFLNAPFICLFVCYSLVTILSSTGRSSLLLMSLEGHAASPRGWMRGWMEDAPGPGATAAEQPCRTPQHSTHLENQQCHARLRTHRIHGRHASDIRPPPPPVMKLSCLGDSACPRAAGAAYRSCGQSFPAAVVLPIQRTASLLGTQRQTQKLMKPRRGYPSRSLIWNPAGPSWRAIRPNQ